MKTTGKGRTRERAQLRIGGERDGWERIVRGGFAKGEGPELKMHGKVARQKNGSIALPAGEPWGWVSVGNGPIDLLRGLRSFTILGWVKPESLETGSGGNRIVFYLNKDHSGVDLVCHADGRLRLSVNEWPDRARNDSSQGRLQVGKWTCFAVTYDAGQAKETVGWYFSEPVAAPGKGALELDRRTTYTAGSVGTDIGTLAIGNFNESMHGYDLDRQFRGEIRGLQIFGSRLSGRGVLRLDVLRRQMAP